MFTQRLRTRVKYVKACNHFPAKGRYGGTSVVCRSNGPGFRCFAGGFGPSATVWTGAPSRAVDSGNGPETYASVNGPNSCNADPLSKFAINCRAGRCWVG